MTSAFLTGLEKARLLFWGGRGVSGVMREMEEQEEVRDEVTDDPSGLQSPLVNLGHEQAV